MQAVATERARSREVQRPDGTGFRHDYYGTPGVIDAGPQAFLVELPYAGATVKPHFHDIDQFQVVVAGNGRIGKKQLAPITFQYADAYTPYGPIVANDEGISFFTLRNIASGGHFKMPGSKHLMACRAGRNIAGQFILNKALPGPGKTHCDTLMEQQIDGVFALGLRLGPQAQFRAPPSDGGGQYFLVCAGALDDSGKALPPNSVLRREAGESTVILTAGTQGAAVLALQFGRPSDRPGSNPAALANRDPQTYVVRKE